MLIRQKLLEQCCTGNVTDNVFFVVNNIYFSLGFFEALDSKGILNSLKKGMTSAMECADVAAFTFAT